MRPASHLQQHKSERVTDRGLKGSTHREAGAQTRSQDILKCQSRMKHPLRKTNSQQIIDPECPTFAGNTLDNILGGASSASHSSSFDPLLSESEDEELDDDQACDDSLCFCDTETCFMTCPRTPSRPRTSSLHPNGHPVYNWFPGLLKQLDQAEAASCRADRRIPGSPEKQAGPNKALYTRLSTTLKAIDHIRSSSTLTSWRDNQNGPEAPGGATAAQNVQSMDCTSEQR